MPSVPVGYPARHEQMVELDDGSALWVRPIVPEDAPRLVHTFPRLSPDTVYLRFFRPMHELSPEEAQRLATVDYRNSMALVALRPRREEDEHSHDHIIAVARYYRTGPEVAEMAITVEDAYQRQGLGTRLIRLLANVARENGIQALDAYVLAENWRMTRALHKVGFPITLRQAEGGALLLRLDLTRPSKGG